MGMNLVDAAEVLRTRNYEGSRDWYLTILQGRHVITDGARWLTGFEAIAAAQALLQTDTPRTQAPA